MERRTVLTTVGIAGATAAAGCLSRASSDDSNDDTDDTGNAGSGDGGSGSRPERTQIASGETDRREVGAGELDDAGLRKPHTVALANRTDAAVAATFAVDEGDETVFEERFELESDASIAVTLTELARYEVEASIDDDASTTETLGPDRFGCNGGQTTIALQPDATFETGTISTLMACPGVVTERVAAGESFEHTIGRGFGAGDSDDDAASEAQHSLGVENPTEESWTVRAVLSEAADVLFDGVFTLEADASVNLPIAEAADYELEASVLETDATASEAVGSDHFDCNVSSTNASVDADGDLEIRTISTTMACNVDDGSTDDSN